MNILITGAGGFLGQHLINFLLKSLHEDDFIYNLGKKKISNCINYNIDDINDKEQINSAISKIRPDYLFHLAGSSDKYLDFESMKSVNTTYSNNLLKALEINNLHDHTKIMIVGSSAEYGPVNNEDLPISEDLKPNPLTNYGKTKYDQTVNSILWQQNSRKLVVVRPFNIIGKHIPDSLAIGSFYSQIRSMHVKGNLRTGNLKIKRDFIDVNDVVNIMWKLINNNNSYGEVINICTGKPTLLSDLVNLMIDLSGKKIKCETEHNRIRKNDMDLHYGNNKKLLSIVNNYKFISCTNSIKKMMKA